MKVMEIKTLVITGSRDYRTPKPIRKAMTALVAAHKITRFAHGAQRGADIYGAAIAQSLFIPNIIPYEADWDTHGKAAGPIRNMFMLDSELEITPREYILVIAFPLPQSKGTYHMINYAKEKRVNVQIYDLNGDLTFQLIQKFV